MNHSVAEELHTYDVLSSHLVHTATFMMFAISHNWVPQKNLCLLLRDMQTPCDQVYMSCKLYSNATVPHCNVLTLKNYCIYRLVGGITDGVSRLQCILHAWCISWCLPSTAHSILLPSNSYHHLMRLRKGSLAILKKLLSDSEVLGFVTRKGIWTGHMASLRLMSE